MDAENRTVTLDKRKRLLAPSKRKTRKRKIALLCFLIGLVIILLGSGYWVYQKSRSQPQLFTATSAKSIDFPLYQPDPVPLGFTIDYASLSITKQAVTYSITYEATKKLAVSLQPIPTNFDFDAFYSNAFKEGRDITTAAGKARIGTLAGVDTISVLTPKTWILVTATDGSESDDFLSIARSFKQYNDQ